MSEEWCTIESDPAVFTELLEQVGVKNVELTELWSLDDDSLSALTADSGGTVYGLIFLFKWTPGTTSTPSGGRTPLVGDQLPDRLFFARQVTTNACATQALLSVVLNAANNNNNNNNNGEDKKKQTIELGSTLEEFRSFTASFPPDLRGEAIGASDELKNAHNRFARPDSAFLAETTHMPPAATDGTDVFHFVAYLPHDDGKVYELDGLQAGPVMIGEDTRDGSHDWMAVARTAIQERMERLSGEIKFNLMAVIRDKRVVLQEKLDAMDKDSTEYQAIQAELGTEHAKRQAWTLENQRRQHNYVPLCMQLLKELARNGSLPQLTTEAKERVEAKRVRQMQK